MAFDPISEADASKAFKELARYTHMPFDYPNDCCHTRAHQMCGLLADQGIGSAKWWHFAPPDVYDNSAPKPKLLVDYRLRVQTPGHVDGKTTFVMWGWHVAPVVRVKTLLGVKKRVFDPSMFDSPVSIAKWTGAQEVLMRSRKSATDDFSTWQKAPVASSNRQEVAGVFFTSRDTLDAATGNYAQKDANKLADPDFLESHIRLGIHLLTAIFSTTDLLRRRP